MVPREGARLDEKQLSTALDGRLARFELPKRVVLVDELPRNAMGRARKAAPRETYKDTFG